MPGASTGTQAGAIRFEQIAANCPRTIQGTNPGSALTSVEDDKVWLHKLRKLVIGGADEHVAHEERMVRARADDADLVAMLRGSRGWNGMLLAETGWGACKAHVLCCGGHAACSVRQRFCKDLREVNWN